MDRQRVAVYVALALVVGFAAGYAVSRYTSKSAEPPTVAAAPVEPSSLVPNTTEGSLESATAAVAESHQYYRVKRVIRADTIDIEVIGPVQMIGIETPDGKAPKEIYEAHGRNALTFTEKSLLGQSVRIEFDPANEARGNKNAAGQTLAYVFTQDDTLFNAEMVRQGHAFVRVTEPFRLIGDFRAYERDAMQAMRGVWGFSASDSTSASTATLGAPATGEKRRLTPLLPSEVGPNLPAISGSASPGEQTVVVSSADRLYHKSGCEYLAKKRQAIPLSQAKSEGYSPCSRCFASDVLKVR